MLKKKRKNQGSSILLKPISVIRPHEYYLIFWIKCLMFSLSFILYYILLIKNPLGKTVQDCGACSVPIN